MSEGRTMEFSAPNSRFRWVYDDAARSAKSSFDQIVHETESFVVLPSIGSLVPGWLLVVPKRPLANLSGLAPDEFIELEGVVNDLGRKLSSFPGKPQIFEHGGPVGASISCGVDQAHLHIVPLDFDICTAAKDDSVDQWEPINGLRSLKGIAENNHQYYFVSGLSGAYVSFPESPISQRLRRLIANKTGNPDAWNYRDHPMVENINITISAMVV